MTRIWKRAPRKSKVWRKPKIPLRQDTTPADPILTRLFHDIQVIHDACEQSDAGVEYELSDDELAVLEADAWQALSDYLTTFEPPKFFCREPRKVEHD